MKVWLLTILFLCSVEVYALTASVGVSGGVVIPLDDALQNGYLVSGRVSLLPTQYISIYGEIGLGRGMVNSMHYSMMPFYFGSGLAFPAKRWLRLVADFGFGYVRHVGIVSNKPVSSLSFRLGGGVRFFQDIRYPLFFGVGIYRSFVGGSDCEGEGLKMLSIDNMSISVIFGYNL
ncbi:MAG TPA: hypothetical protein ENI43_04665 [Firmicutes bacterium]|nr:hypothetical protein [Bacillota bacterium]